jgi:CRISPR-associated exonuclease Cas4
MTYSEDELLPISALQHLMFCERQCGLIHIEQVWAENRLTAEGRILHEKVHDGGTETRGDKHVARGLHIQSRELGLVGIADVVEFIRDENGVEVTGMAGRWRPFPVEYKRGKPKPDHCDLIQLCAQALCLEEMLGAPVREGAIFYGQPRRRMEVAIDEPLRKETADTAYRLHELIKSGVTPAAEYDPKCKQCSLWSECLPKSAAAHKSAKQYLEEALA